MAPSLLTDRQRKALTALAIVGLAAFLLGLLTDPQRTRLNLLLCNFYLLGLSVGSAVFIAMHYLARAGWPTALRRIPEAMTAYLPLGAMLMLSLCLSIESVYEWSRLAIVADGPASRVKALFLNSNAFAARTAIYVVLWWIFARILVAHSRRQDVDGQIRHTERSIAISAVFIAVFAISMSLASVDWVMSLEPDWYSTIFPWYVFAGILVNVPVAITVLLLLLQRNGHFRRVNEHHLHDLGKYIFGFSFFWGYLWFCQYLLIWYANIPEESAYFVRRTEHSWSWLFLTNPLMNMALPFCTLLPAAAKRSARVMLLVCILLLLGHWVDLYLMIMPPFLPSGPAVGWIEVGLLLGLGSLFALTVDRGLRQAAELPENDPTLEESLSHRS